MTESIHWKTATDLAANYRDGSSSPRVATQAILDRIELLDPELCAFAQRFGDVALADAEGAERELRAGNDRGALHGIPIAVKDLCDVKGYAAGAGTTVLRDRIAAADSTVVARLRAAGAVVVGTLQMTEGAYTNHHPDITPPYNPWNRERWTGISSSGSGVAVAAGMCFGAIGTDTGGSIRFPSAANGLVGIKPTYGRVSRAGVFPLSMSLDHVGPICRSVRDAANMLQIMAGADSRDPSADQRAVPDFAVTLEDGIAGVRIGVDEAYVRDSSHEAVADLVLACADVLKEAGAEIVPTTVPPVGDIIGPWMAICATDAAAAHSEFFPEHREQYGPGLAELLDFAADVSGADVARAIDAKRDFAGRIAAFFTRVDLLLCPSLGVPVPPRIPDWQDLSFVGAVIPYTSPYDASGSPTISLPCGQTDDGMPVSLQLVGRHFEEALLCRAGEVYERATQWHARHPEI
jgi:amidase